MKDIIICADDFGYNEAISDSLIHLAHHKRISAISCMTNMPAWHSHACHLKEMGGQVSLGLHLNLTEGPATYPDAKIIFNQLPRLLSQSFMRRLDAKLIQAEINSQITQFIEQVGRKPDFIDGHQHIHHFPVIRDQLLTVYQQYYPHQEAAIRISSNPFQNHLKKWPQLKEWVIAFTGSYPLKKQLERLKIPYNASFSGIYNLMKPSSSYPDLFESFINQTKHHGLIMCHPGKGVDKNTHQDPISQSRENEYEFFMSQAFLDITRDVNIIPFRKGTLGSFNS